MAKPPERIEELLPAAEVGVLAEVVKVLEQGAQAAVADTQATSTPSVAARQVVELRIKSVLFGAPGDTVKVTKPAGGYALREGNHGPFLLGRAADGALEILGRYGPDTWPEAVVREAVARR